MKKEKLTLAPAKLLANTGELVWLPRNPRQWKQDDIDKTSRSIAEDPDFLEDRPVLAVPSDDGKFVVFAGNLRLTAAKSISLASIPVVVYTPETEADRETIKRRALKDNGSFGDWDWDILANEWEGPFNDWGIPAWDPEPSFHPNLQPIDGIKPVTDADIVKAGENLVEEVTPTEKQTIEVICPHCGKVFQFKV